MDESASAAGLQVHSQPLAGCGLRRATMADTHRLRDVLAEAFFDDPVFGWLMPDETKRRGRLRRYFGIDLQKFTLPLGCVWTTDDLTGAALSLPPGAWRVPLRTTLLHGTAFGAHLPRAARLGATMEWRHLRESHYYVRDIGVLPGLQGNGLGSTLLRPTLDRCDRESLPAYLEASSERSAALYERHGFKITDELRVGGSPPLRLMRRPPDRERAAP